MCFQKKRAKVQKNKYICKFSIFHFQFSIIFCTFAQNLSLHAGNHTALYLGALPLGGF